MNVNDIVAAKIEAARARAEAAKRRRAAFAAARQRGLALRHAQKLHNQASAAIASEGEPSVSFRDWLNQNRDHEECVILAAVPGAWASAEELHEELHRSSAHGERCALLAMTKDAWLAMTDQWQYDCVDCRTDCTDERYMVHDQIWEAAGMCPFGFLCIGCIERRLSRRLAAADFLDVPLNHARGFRRSERLAARLTSSV